MEVGVGDTTAEFPKMKGLLKLGPSVGWVAPCFCPPVAPNASWRVAPGDSGKGGLEPDPKGTVNAEAGLEMLDDNEAWCVVTRAEVDRGLPTPLKLAVVLLGEIWTALERTWLKMVTVCTVGMVARWCGGKTKPVAGAKLVLKAQAAPRRKVWQVEGMV